jgi:superfamily I DNA/RNA helicase
MSADRRIELNERQERAVRAGVEPASNVVAGAGTGKTSVLVERYLRLVAEDGLPVERVLALTFTLKAAGEMRERVRAEMARRHPDLAPRLASAWIMNFHQFGYRFIRENAPALGVDPGIGVVSPAEFKRIEAVLRGRFESGRIEGVPADFGGDPPSPTSLPDLFKRLVGVVHHCRGSMIELESLRDLCRDDDHPVYRARVETVIALGRAYEAELRRRNLLDYSDMIIIPVRGMRDVPELARRWRGAFEHILVDEFQDTSEAQNEMLRMLSSDRFDRVTVVGDMKQSIYRWRDARVENLRDFTAVESVDLEVNYRSTQKILDLAHALAVRAPDLASATPLRAHRHGAPAHPVVLFHPRAGEPLVEDEARSVAAWVGHLLGMTTAPAAWRLAPVETPLRPEDVAILLRRFAGGEMRSALEAALSDLHIPYAIVGGANTAEARALHAWHAMLSMLLPGDRTPELISVLETDPFRVTDATLYELIAPRDREGDGSAFARLRDERLAAVEDAHDRAVLGDLRVVLGEMREARARLGFRAFLAWMLEHAPLRLRLAGDGVPASAMDELARDVIELADKIAANGEITLASFLEHLGAALEERKFREEGEARMPAGRVAVMTIHQAKGLEFPAVAVPDVVPRRATQDGFLVVRGEGLFFGGDDARDWNRHRESSPAFAAEEAMKELEERCVLYVAMTRARDHLWVSSPRAEGSEPLKKGPKTSLFTELLECARGTDLAIELRDAPEATGARAEAQVDDHPGAGGEELEDALAAWGAARAAADPSPTGAPPPLELVTWRALARFADCPLAFARDREVGRAAPADEPDDAAAATRRDVPETELPRGADAGAFGAMVHAALEALSRDDGQDLESLLETLARRFRPGGRPDDVRAAARDLVGPALAHGLAGPSAGARMEVHFTARLETLAVHGVIDRLDESSRGALVTDYKVGEPAAAHAFQVRVYTWAADRALNRRDARGRVVYLRRGEAHCEDVATPDTSAEIDAIARAMDRAITSGEFPAAPGAVCAACAYRGSCEHAIGPPPAAGLTPGGRGA